MGMCVMNRAGPGRQSDKPQMHRTLDWTGLSSLVFPYIAKQSSKTSYFSWGSANHVISNHNCSRALRAVELVRLWWRCCKKKAFKGAEVWRSSQLALTGTPGPFQLFIHNLFGFTSPLFHHSRVNPHTHFTTLPPNVKKRLLYREAFGTN